MTYGDAGLADGRNGSLEGVFQGQRGVGVLLLGAHRHVAIVLDRVGSHEGKIAEQLRRDLGNGLRVGVVGTDLGRQILVELRRLAEDPGVVEPAVEYGLVFLGAVLALGLPGTGTHLAVQLVLVRVYQAVTVTDDLRELVVEPAEAVLAIVQFAEQETPVAKLPLALEPELVGLRRGRVILGRIDGLDGCEVVHLPVA